MKILTWIIQGLLSLMFLMAGFTKLFTPYMELKAMDGMSWAEDFSPNTILIIGALEVLAVIGMTLPILLKKFTFFSPLSALGLAGIMVGGVITHSSRGEAVIIESVLFVFAMAVAFLRKGEFSSK